MKRPGLGVLVLVASLLAVIGIVTACSNQGQGEVCNVQNDSDDCKTDENLICYPFNQLNNTTSDRCCPLDRSTSTHPVCLTSTGVISDAAAPSETGPGTVTQDAQVGDDAGDAGSDADAQP